MLEYLLASTFCLASLLLFHKLILEKKTKHEFKRFFLIASVFLAAIIPLITFTTNIRVAKPLVISNPITNLVESPVAANPFPWFSILLIAYFIGLSIFLFRFIRNLKSIYSEINSNSKISKGNYSLVLLEKSCIPHSFLNFVFVSKSDYENNEIPASVIYHEEIHTQQKHTLDIIFAEILHCLAWFNPLCILLKKEIQMNHEYLADEAVLKAGYEAKEYQSELLKFIHHGPSPSLSHSFHFKPLKKRVEQMKNQNQKKSSKNWRMLRITLIAPMVAMLIFAFSSNTYHFYVESETTGIGSDKEANEAEIALYNSLARYYSNPKGENIVFQKDEIDYLKLIYANMTEDQKKNAEPFPVFPEILPYEIDAVEMVRNTPHSPLSPPLRVIDLKYEKHATFYLNEVEASYDEILKATEDPPFPVTIRFDEANSKYMVNTDGSSAGC